MIFKNIEMRNTNGPHSYLNFFFTLCCGDLLSSGGRLETGGGQQSPQSLPAHPAAHVNQSPFMTEPEASKLAEQP